jgi:TPR repeat protein
MKFMSFGFGLIFLGCLAQTRAGPDPLTTKEPSRLNNGSTEEKPSRAFAFTSEPENLARLRKRAEANEIDSQFRLAVYYANGAGATKDVREAARWFLKAAEQTHAGAQFELGNCYFLGHGVTKDHTEAVKWYRRAAEQNHSGAQSFLGNAFYLGDGVGKDYAKALQWYRKGAQQNHPLAQLGLGHCYHFGEGVEKDYANAYRWYRKSADQNVAGAQFALGNCYYFGEGMPVDYSEAVKWYQKAASQGMAEAQFNVGNSYFYGDGVRKDCAEAVKWYQKAVRQNYPGAQFALGRSYYHGEGLPKNYADAVEWYRKAALQNHPGAQFSLGLAYFYGEGVRTNDVQSYSWMLFAEAQGVADATSIITELEFRMTQQQIRESYKLATSFIPHFDRSPTEVTKDGSAKNSEREGLISSGTGFFITDDGYFITSEHVIGDASLVKVVLDLGSAPARVIKRDKTSDLALLKVRGRFSGLPVASSQAVKLGQPVATVGFPNSHLQGIAPKFARGDIAALSGIRDDTRDFQISVPVQPGNSGGALVDERGNVIGVISAKLSAGATFAITGALPENVNYAVKGSFLLSFLESVPGVSAKLKKPSTEQGSVEDVASVVREASVLVLTYPK